MPRIEQVGHHLVLHLSSDDTWRWATQPGRRWPCSRASGKHLRVEIDSAGNKGKVTVRDPLTAQILSDYEIPTDELDAIVSDHLPQGHPGRRE